MEKLIFLFTFVYRAIGFLKLYAIGLIALVSQLITRHITFGCEGIDKSGVVAIVTGGSDGIGFETSQALAKCGVRVIIGGRNETKAHYAIKRIKAKNKSALVEYMHLDLTSLQSVKDFSSAFLDKKIPLNLLINNAGVMIPPLHRTEEGFEEQFGVNFLAHFLLTGLLLDKLKESGTAHGFSRIVNVASEAHRPGLIEWDNLNAEQDYSPHAAYSQSKLAVILSTYWLQRRLASSSSYVTANALHPGVVNTRLYRHITLLLKPLFFIVGSLLYKSSRQGADTVLFAALSPSLEGRGGLYIDNCQKTRTSYLSYDHGTQHQLQREASRMLGEYGKHCTFLAPIQKHPNESKVEKSW